MSVHNTAYLLKLSTNVHNLCIICLFVCINSFFIVNNLINTFIYIFCEKDLSLEILVFFIYNLWISILFIVLITSFYFLHTLNYTFVIQFILTIFIVYINKLFTILFIFRKLLINFPDTGVFCN